MRNDHNTQVPTEDHVRHDLSAHITMYGKDMDILFQKLPATIPRNSWWALCDRSYPMLTSEKVIQHLLVVAEGLSKLPTHLLIDDGAFQPPYKNVAFRAEAAWHRDALERFAERLDQALSEAEN